MNVTPRKEMKLSSTIFTRLPPFSAEGEIILEFLVSKVLRNGDPVVSKLNG
jgi:hypothetical protein